jgi:hypothetical protein
VQLRNYTGGLVRVLVEKIAVAEALMVMIVVRVIVMV